MALTLESFSTLLDTKLDTKLASLLEKINPRFEAIESDIIEVKEQITSFQRRVILSEAEFRSNNVLIFGIPEPSKKESARHQLQDMLGLDLGDRDCFRLGRYKEESKRPVLVKNYSRTEKWGLQKDLLGEKLVFSDDLPQEVRTARKEPIPKLKAARSEGKKARIGFPANLRVDGVIEIRNF